MSNVVRLVNGGTIQVRTGVIQGIGPQGPRGVAGPPGVQGEQGPVGETGPMGQILKQQSKTAVAGSNPLSAGSDVVIAFGAIDYDDMACFPPASTSNIILAAVGDYMLSCWLRFDATPPKAVEMWYVINAVLVAGTNGMTDASVPTYLNLAFPYRVPEGAAPQTLNVHARSTGGASAISQGAMAVSRIGSGPPGPIGPQGVQGEVGPNGAVGEQGIPGSASTGFATYADLLP